MEKHRFPFRAMGSPCKFQLYTDTRAQAETAYKLAHTEVMRLEKKYSRYRKDSVISMINNAAGSGKAVKVDNETSLLLDYAHTVYKQSEGLFDITSGVLRRAWDFRANKLPQQKEIEQNLALVGWDKVEWKRPYISLTQKGMELDFGGYVKEYAVDAAASSLKASGCTSGLVDLGGDIKVLGNHPDGDPWRVGIQHPREPEKAIATTTIAQGAIASSGDYERFMMVDGKRYTHILNPKTGWPIESFCAVSVIASECLIAGSCSTIAMLKGEKAGKQWLENLQLPYLCVDSQLQVSGSTNIVN
jgi:thiamine biosynthesis lipoprotein